MTVTADGRGDSDSERDSDPDSVPDSDLESESEPDSEQDSDAGTRVRSLAVPPPRPISESDRRPARRDLAIGGCSESDSETVAADRPAVLPRTRQRK
jgi:hypothetical protein